MSFFEPPPPRREPPDEPQPPWLGPPDNVVGAGVPMRVVLVRTEEVAAAITGATAYPQGVLLDLSIRLRKPRQHPDFFHPFMLHGRGGDFDELFRFGVQLADGSKATTLRDHPPFDVAEPAGPVLWPRGGGGGGRSWDWGFWLWPLPPRGPLAFVVEWPAMGIPETRHEVDAAPILEAAARAEVLWENGAVTPGGGFTTQIRLQSFKADE